MIKNYLFLLITLVSCSNQFQLKEGDLLFQDLDSSPLCDAIELVTPGYKEASFSHIGIVIKDNDTLKVLEAIPPKVILTKLNDFLNKSSDRQGRPKVIVGRLKKQFQHAIPHAIKFSKERLNTDYDEFFLIDNNSYYCSELIYEAFKKYSIFELHPMTFVHPESQKTIKTWIEYYSNLNYKIPEGMMGINPGIMSISSKIDIVNYYGTPDNMIK